MLNWVELEKSFITSGLEYIYLERVGNFVSDFILSSLDSQRLLFY